MAGNGSVAFKTSMRGFDKKDVMDYIEDMTRASQANEQRLNKKIEDLQKERQHLDGQVKLLTANVSKLEEAISQLEGSLGDEKQKVSTLSSAVIDLNQEIDRQKSRYDQRVRELGEQKQLNLQLAKERDLLKKQRGVDTQQAAAQIGEVMVQAKLYADEMVSKAKNEADTVYNAAMQATGSLGAEIMKIKDDLTQLKGTFKQASDLLDERLDNIVQMAQNLQNNIGAQVKRWYDAVAEEPISPTEEGEDARQNDQDGAVQDGVQQAGSGQTNE
ncbi:MAG: hypothetical protein ACLSAP_00165 [Oscillospiraceae bacterium]